MPQSKRTATGVLGGLAGLVGLSVITGVLVTATITPAIAVSGTAASSAITIFNNLPSALEISTGMLPTTIYAKNPDSGQYEVMTKFYDQNRIPVTWDQIAPVMYDAILSSEDPRYYEHGGIDLIGTARALLSNAKGDANIQGGSSISQQYVKNILVQQCYSKAESTDFKDDTKKKLTAQQQLDAAVQKCYTDATNSKGASGIQRKLQEMRYAIALEQKYSKKDILLGYLNIANFGGVTYGIEAASEYYFGVHAKDLDYQQAAILAGMVQNPNTFRLDQPGNKANGEANDYALTKTRQKYVLTRMDKDGKITTAQYREGLAAKIVPSIHTPQSGCAATAAPYFCQYVVSVVNTDPAFGATSDARARTLKQGGLNIYTTLDWRLQNAAQNTLSQRTPATIGQSTWKYGATIVNIENSTGRVLSMAQNTTFSYDKGAPDGSTGIIYAGDKQHGSSSGFAPGSTFKIFTILDWLEKGHSLNEVLNGNVRVYKKFTNSCPGQGDWINYKNEKVGNFDNERGYVGTPLQFTSQSLNSGFFAMASKLDLCDIANDAAKLDVTNANGKPITMPVQNSIIGNTQAVSPLAMGSAFATVANNGVQCQPKVIDRVTDSTGKDRALPNLTCAQKVDPNVAATAAYDLQGVMRGGYQATGALGNPNDGTQLMGKTGTNEANQTWLIESSTAATTVVWSGVSDGVNLPDGSENPHADLFHTRYRGTLLSDLRYVLSKAQQKVVDQYYPGGAFPAPDATLTKQTLTNLPNVVGLSQDQASQALQDAGFQVAVGPAVDSTLAAGTIAQQTPGAGQVAGGTTVTISPSNGQGIQVPDVSGKAPGDAVSAMRGAGFGNVKTGNCTQDPAAPDGGKATGTDPPAGTVGDANTAITVNYSAKNCGGPGGGNH